MHWQWEEQNQCRAFSSTPKAYVFHQVFSPFWGENILVGPGRKYPGLTNFFPLLLSTNTYQKCFFSLSLSSIPLKSIQPNIPYDSPSVNFFSLTDVEVQKEQRKTKYVQIVFQNLDDVNLPTFSSSLYIYFIF